MIDKKARIYVSGHMGMVGNSLVRLLKMKGYANLILRTSKELDLRDQNKVDKFIKKACPDYVFLIAGKVGGIKANITYPAEFLYDNLMIAANIINASYKNNIKKLMYLGSSCSYPRECPQPMKEEYLLAGKLEPTNEGYALAKITGLKLCEYYNSQFGTNFICAIPSNLYGPYDNFDLENSHVIAAMIRKFHQAKINTEKKVVLWGTGRAYREFLYVDDLASACLFLMNIYNKPNFINVGFGEDVTIKELAYKIKEIIGFKGKIVWDLTKPDGMPRKILSVAKLNLLGWKPRVTLEDGIGKTYNWFIKNY